MKLSQFKVVSEAVVTEAKEEPLTGTNCSNCRFIELEAKKVSPGALNEQGGCDPKGADEMARAKEFDLITLPGNTNMC